MCFAQCKSVPFSARYLYLNTWRMLLTLIRCFHAFSKRKSVGSTQTLDMNNLRSLCWGLDDFPDKAQAFCERNIHRPTELSVLVSLGGLRCLAKPLYGSPRSSGRNLSILVNFRPMRRFSPTRSERRASYRVAFIDF